MYLINYLINVFIARTQSTTREPSQERRFWGWVPKGGRSLDCRKTSHSGQDPRREDGYQAKCIKRTSKIHHRRRWWEQNSDVVCPYEGLCLLLRCANSQRRKQNEEDSAKKVRRHPLVRMESSPHLQKRPRHLGLQLDELKLPGQGSRSPIGRLRKLHNPSERLRTRLQQTPP